MSEVLKAAKLPLELWFTINFKHVVVLRVEFHGADFTEWRIDNEISYTLKCKYGDEDEQDCNEASWYTWNYLYDNFSIVIRNFWLKYFPYFPISVTHTNHKIVLHPVKQASLHMHYLTPHHSTKNNSLNSDLWLRNDLWAILHLLKPIILHILFLSWSDGIFFNELNLVFVTYAHLSSPCEIAKWKIKDWEKYSKRNCQIVFYGLLNQLWWSKVYNKSIRNKVLCSAQNLRM